jgi:hypothetical protein
MQERALLRSPGSSVYRATAIPSQAGRDIPNAILEIRDTKHLRLGSLHNLADVDRSSFSSSALLDPDLIESFQSLMLPYLWLRLISVRCRRFMPTPNLSKRSEAEP